MRKIFDAFAVLCWMQGEPGAAYVEHLMAEAEKGSIEIMISAINVGEVYYRLLKSGQAEAAASFQADVKNKVFPWRVVPASNRRIWLAATLKGRYSISYADAFAIALGVEFGGELVTRDPEILRIAAAAELALDPLPVE